MDAMIDLIFKIVIAGGFLVLAIQLVRSKKFSSSKTEVLNMQAKLSKARMALKAKVKKKFNTFHSSIKVIEGDEVDNLLKKLIENNFETSQNFQDYFDTSRKVVSTIQGYKKEAGRADTPLDIENNFMCSDFKTELDIIRIIKEMNSLSTKINSKIEENNRKYPNNVIQRVDDLIFDSLTDVNRVYKVRSEESSSDNSGASESTPPTNPTDSTKKVS
jgi:hypothetical protein